jgi:peptide/nickel transport system substrate-binding protein
VVDASTVRINLTAPFAPLLTVLTDRAGMMVSPKAAAAAGEQVRRQSGLLRTLQVRRAGRAGPHRAGALRGLLEQGRDPLRARHLPADRRRHGAPRQPALRQLDFIERLAPSDVKGLRSDSRFKIDKIVEIGYQGITINTAKSDLAQKNPLGKDARVREAFELSLDRDGIVQVAMDGEADKGNQWVAPVNRYYGKSAGIPKREVARAKKLLADAGTPNPSFTLMTPTTSDAQRIAQVVQAMAKEAGFDVKIQSTEFATSLNLADKGQFEAYVLAWSGAQIPTATCTRSCPAAGPTNYSGYCSKEVDALINETRVTLDPAKRAAALRQDRRAGAEGTGRSSTCSTATGCGRTAPSSRGCARCPTAWCASRV